MSDTARTTDGSDTGSSSGTPTLRLSIPVQESYRPASSPGSLAHQTSPCFVGGNEASTDGAAINSQASSGKGQRVNSESSSGGSNIRKLTTPLIGPGVRHRQSKDFANPEKGCMKRSSRSSLDTTSSGGASSGGPPLEGASSELSTSVKEVSISEDPPGIAEFRNLVYVAVRDTSARSATTTPGKKSVKFMIDSSDESE